MARLRNEKEKRRINRLNNYELNTEQVNRIGDRNKIETEAQRNVIKQGFLEHGLHRKWFVRLQTMEFVVVLPDIT